MRVRKGGWSLLPAAVSILAAWGCQGPGGPAETVQAPGPAGQGALAAAYQNPASHGDSSQNRSLCSFAPVDRSAGHLPGNPATTAGGSDFGNSKSERGRGSLPGHRVAGRDLVPARAGRC